MIDAKVINPVLGTFGEIRTFKIISAYPEDIFFKDVETGEYYYDGDLEIINN